MNISYLNGYKFSTEKGNDYIFDNVLGMVFPCTNAIYYTILNYYKLPKEEILNDLIVFYAQNKKEAGITYRYVQTVIENGSFYSQNDTCTKEELVFEDILQTPMSQLILIVTEECNIRCKYCIYSDNYPHVKTYSNHRMSLEIAKKAIDYYVKLHKMRVERGFQKGPVISFYGGEPLLEFNLIKSIVYYCKEKNYNITFFITTNATLFTDEMIHFMIDENIVLTISLDGTKRNHDRNRIFANGKGTYDVVMKNITTLQKEKIKKNKKIAITFSCCFDEYTDLCEIVKFFDENHDLFYPYNILYNQISKYNTTYYDDCDKEYQKDQRAQEKHNLENSIQILKQQFIANTSHNTQIPSVGVTHIFYGLMSVIWRSKGLLRNPSDGACIPGSKIAVSPEGKFYICERVSQIQAIGDVNIGLDLEKINAIRNEFVSILKEHCHTCPLSRLCSICYSHFVKDEGITFNTQLCMDNRNQIPKSLETVFSILEENPKAFDILLPHDSKKEFFETNTKQ